MTDILFLGYIRQEATQGRDKRNQNTRQAGECLGPHAMGVLDFQREISLLSSGQLQVRALRPGWFCQSGNSVSEQRTSPAPVKRIEKM